MTRYASVILRWDYYPALDGIRTLAVYLVIAFHAGLAWLDGGFVGVDLFFVLSGFVVGNVLLAELAGTGRISLGRFYARRVRRLLPAAILVIAVTSLVFVLIAPLTRRASMIADAQSALLYVANWHFISQSQDYFAEGVQQSPFLHFWSLAVEEQFYLLFPVLLLGLAWLARRRRGAMVAGLGVLLVLSLAAQIYWSQVDPSHAYYGTDARLYQLLTGALLAVALRSPRTRDVLARGRRPLALGILGVAGLVLVSSGVLDVATTWSNIGAAVVAALLITTVMTSQQSVLARLLGHGTPAYLGRISYGTYLWHWPIILGLGIVLTTSPWITALLAAGLSTGLAALSYELFEMPIRSSSVLRRFQWRSVLAGATGCVLAAALVAPGVLQLERDPALAGSTSAQQTVPVSAQSEPIPQVDWQALREHQYDTRNCTPDQVRECRVRKGGENAKDILLVGDSHAMMVLPALERVARRHDLGLWVNALPGCMWQSGLVNTRPPQERQQACTRQRVDWYQEALRRIDPEVVILAGRPMDEPDRFGAYVQSRTKPGEPLQQATRQATYRTLRRIGRQVPHVLVVDPIVVPETFDPLDCLSAAEQAAECAVPLTPDAPRTAGYYDAAAARLDHVEILDLTKDFCPDAPVCQPVVDGTVVWRDAGHLTARFTRERARQVWQSMTSTSAFSSGE